MPRKQSSAALSTLAAKILSGEIETPTKAQIKRLAASVLAQDETRGQKPRT